MIRGLVAGAVIALLLLGSGLAQPQPQGLAPLIGAEQTIYPEVIYYRGSGEPDRATIQMDLRALREEPFPLDLVLVVDRSASVDILAVREIGKAILAVLDPEDRAGLVSFGDEATLEVALTWNKGSVEARLDRLRNAGKTALGEGLALANRELLEKGREEALLVQVLLIDGRSNIGREPLPQAELAARSAITIFAIGIGRYLDPDLPEIASLTGGLFFPEYDERVPGEILAALERDLLARGIKLERTLARGFSFERAITTPPTRITEQEGLTTLEWEVERLVVGESWTAVFEVAYLPEIVGFQALKVDAVPLRIEFTDFRQRSRELELSPLGLTVRGPNQSPVADFDFSPKEPRTLDTLSFEDLSSDPDGTIVRWLWEFGDGTSSTEQNPRHRYADDGIYLVKLTVWDNEGATGSKEREIKVLNIGPIPSFTYSPERPGVGQKVVFDASGSQDPDGEIMSYEWDLDGDGSFETEGLIVEKIYDQAGSYQVTLRVTDDDGASGTLAQEVIVHKPAIVTREINTYLHVDETLPGQTFQVTVTIEVNTDINGLGLDENLPEGWEVTPVESAGMIYHEKEVQWLLLGKLPAGSIKKVVYNVTVPPDALLKIYDIKGNISSASPRFEAVVEGEGQVEIVDRLPISWVISRWDTEKDQFDIQLGDIITFDQIQQAVAWWLEGKVIEYTGGAVIDLRTMEELVAYWLTDTPVYEPLP